MQELEFIYMAFFLTVGAFLLGAIISWNLKGIFDEWVEKADYAAVTIHPEMRGEDGYADPSELLYLRFTEEDATIDDDEES
tara:strand:- start:335 stop:577 length:243 start_codon:yes stop_codon:yes gene_type:complete